MIRDFDEAKRMFNEIVIFVEGGGLNKISVDDVSEWTYEMVEPLHNELMDIIGKKWKNREAVESELGLKLHDWTPSEEHLGASECKNCGKIVFHSEVDVLSGVKQEVDYCPNNQNH